MNSLLPDNKSWINRILQKDMCKLLLQAAILAINLPFICDMPNGFTIQCKHKDDITCQDEKCGWNGFNFSKEEVINNTRFKCRPKKATGRYYCLVDIPQEGKPFCNSNKECGFQDGFQKGTCKITKTTDLSKTTPRPDMSTSQASRDDTNELELQQGKDSVTNNTDDGGACTGERTITCIVVAVGVLIAALVVIGILMYHRRRLSCPGGQNSRAQSDAQPIRTMAIIIEQEGHGTELGAEPGEEMGEEVGEGTVMLEKLDGEPNGGEDSGDITIPLRQQSPHSTDDRAPEPGN